MKRLGLLVTLLAIMMVFFVGCAGGSESGSDMSLEQQERIIIETTTGIGWAMTEFDDVGDFTSYSVSMYNANYAFTIPSGFESAFLSNAGMGSTQYIGDGASIAISMSITGGTLDDFMNGNLTSDATLTLTITARDSQLPGGSITLRMTYTIISGTETVTATLNGQIVAEEILEDVDMF